MKILWHSNSSASPAGYGVATRLFTRELKRLGHDVTISSYFGVEGHQVVNEDGILELPRAVDNFGNDIIQAHVQYTGAELVISLMDPFVLNPQIWGVLPWAAWVPVDSTPPFGANIEAVRSARFVVAMSEFGARELRNVGFNAYYVPLAVDTETYHPVDRSVARANLARFLYSDIPDDKFLVVTVAANKGEPSRKNFKGMLEAFAEFSKTHPDALFYLHTDAIGVWQGEFIPAIARAYGLSDKLLMPDQYAILTGLVKPAAMNDIYNAADVFMLLSHGEGFGLPIIEAQASGCPAIVPDFSSSPELVGSGWKVATTPYMYKAGLWQSNPVMDAVQRALSDAYDHKGTSLETIMRREAVEFAQAYDVKRVTEKYWQPLLHEFERELKAEQARLPESLAIQAAVNGQEAP